MIDGTVAPLPGLESSIHVLTKLLKKKREEVIKQAERLHSINSSFLSVTNSIPIVQQTTASPISCPSIYTPPQTTLLTVDSSNLSSQNSSYVLNPLTDEISNRIATNIIDWLKKNQHDLNLMNMDF